MGLSHADQKNFRATSKYPASNAGEAVHVPVCIDGHPDSKKPKWEMKSWREDFTFRRTTVSHLDILPKETAAKKVIRLVICMHTGDV